MGILDRTQAPPFQLSSDYSIARPDVFMLPRGSKLFAFRQIQQEAVKLELIFEAGKWFEPGLGISHFTSQMLSKGTPAKNSFQIAEGLDSLGAHLEISPGFDEVTLTLFALRKNLRASLEIVMELLASPSFDEEELRLMKDIFLQTLEVNNEKTSVLASKEIRRAIFGADHPYGSSVEEGDVAKINRGDLQAFFRNNFLLRSAILVGRLTDAEITALIDTISPAVSDGVQSPPPKFPLGIAPLALRQDRVQASIRLGKRCMPKGETSTYFDAVMFNHVLGGFFGSRLMKNIREEKGLTYGIYSAMHHFLRDSFWVIGAEVNRENAGQAIDEIRKEIIKLQQEPVPLSELEIARNYFIGSWQSENSTLFSVAEKFKNVELWGLSDNFFSNLLAHVQEITPSQIQSVANTYFGDVDLFEVKVGTLNPGLGSRQ